MFAWFKRKSSAVEATEIDIFDAPPIVLGYPAGGLTSTRVSSDQANLSRAEQLILAARSVA